MSQKPVEFTTTSLEHEQLYGAFCSLPEQPNKKPLYNEDIKIVASQPQDTKKACHQQSYSVSTVVPKIGISVSSSKKEFQRFQKQSVIHSMKNQSTGTLHTLINDAHLSSNMSKFNPTFISDDRVTQHLSELRLPLRKRKYEIESICSKSTNDL